MSHQVRSLLFVAVMSRRPHLLLKESPSVSDSFFATFNKALGEYPANHPARLVSATRPLVFFAKLNYKAKNRFLIERSRRTAIQRKLGKDSPGVRGSAAGQPRPALPFGRLVKSQHLTSFPEVVQI